MIAGFLSESRKFLSNDHVLTKKLKMKNSTVNPVANPAIELLANKRKNPLIATKIKM
jgi:hypothetical protein